MQPERKRLDLRTRLCAAVMDSDHPAVTHRHREAAAEARAAAKARDGLAGMFNREGEARCLLAAVHNYARCERLELTTEEALRVAAEIAERSAL